MAIRVLIADDHAAIRSGLRLTLERAADITVVAEAADGETAVTNARATRPDVVLMDLRMPGVDGIAATRRITQEGYGSVLVLTTYDLDEHVVGALRAGAVGFLLKTIEADALVDAVRRVAAGEGVLAPEVTRRLLTAFVALPDTAPSAPPAWADELSGREHEVLDALARGLSNAQICAELTISAGTTKTHVSRILAKLGCESRLQAAILAREAGFGSE